MQIDVLNIEGKKVSTVELPAAIFEAQINVNLMHQAFIRQMANAHLGTHDTKTRNEVAGGGRKPWRQKGTGRARQGSIRAAQWKGGGRIHTPHPRSYEQDMPRKMRRAALRSALSVKASENSIVVVDNLSIPEAKTKVMASILNNLVGSDSVLVLIPEKAAFEGVIRTSNNLPDTKVLLANYLNIRDLMKYQKIVFPLASLDVVQGYLG
ncbi:MAG: 50S ribosomal protein L4 [Anaerolineaceae bacterium]|jgi:large subunit ribosomal protein L4|nr:50S ribosomal protein L4 [Anaerolineaceae bacterium]